MGVNKAIRADDVSGLNIATTQFSDSDAVTKDFQRVVINNSTDGTMATVNATGLKVDASGATVPVSVAATLNVKPTDGANAISKTFDLDSSGTTHEWNVGVGLRKKASGGSVEVGTSSDPVRTDPTGTTVQPVSAASLPLPSGAATAAKQPALGTAGTPSADVITVQGITSMTALKVDGSGVTQPVSGTFFQATQPVSIAATVVVKADTAGNQANALKVDGSAVTQPVSGTVTVGNATLAVTESGTWTVQPGNTANTTPWLVQSVPATSGGLGAPFSASQTSTKGVVKASAGTLYGYEIVNNGSALCYIQVFNKLTASVTVGTTAPDWVIPVPAPSSGTAGAGIVHELDKGYSFGTGLVIACTTTRTGSTSATCDVNFFFD